MLVIERTERDGSRMQRLGRVLGAAFVHGGLVAATSTSGCGVERTNDVASARERDPIPEEGGSDAAASVCAAACDASSPLSGSTSRDAGSVESPSDPDGTVSSPDRDAPSPDLAAGGPDAVTGSPLADAGTRRPAMAVPSSPGVADASVPTTDVVSGVCIPDEARCLEDGSRERCSPEGGGFEPDGECAVELFDAFDSRPMFARRADGSFTVISDIQGVPELEELAESGLRVNTIVVDTDSDTARPWIVDTDGNLFRFGGEVIATGVRDAHSSHDSNVVLVMQDGSAAPLSQSTTLLGDFVSVIGHAGSIWLLDAEGTLSEGLDATTLGPREWLQMLPGAFQKVFVLDADLCGLTLDGDIACAPLTPGAGWLADVPSGPFVDLACNFRTCYALRPDGAVDCFSTQVECVPPEGPFVDIATGIAMLCGIRPDGGISCVHHNGSELDPSSIDRDWR